MIERLDAIVTRFNEINEELSSPNIVNDIKKMTELSKEQRRLSQTVEIYEKYKGILSDIEAAKELAHRKKVDVTDAKKHIFNRPWF